MPNATVSAAGGAMPADRRTILRSILAVGATGAAPIAAGAAEAVSAHAGLDAELFGLIDAARKLKAGFELAYDDVLSAGRHEAKARGGKLEAEAREQSILDEERKLWARIARTRAQTMEGIIAKLASVSYLYDPDDDLGGKGDDILVSAALDAAALAGQTGEARVVSEERKYLSAYLDLESEIRDLMHMAAIATDLATNLIGQLGERDGEQTKLPMSIKEQERVLFAISNTSFMADALEKKWTDAAQRCSAEADGPH